MFPMTTYSGQDLSRVQASDNLLLHLCLIASCADRISQLAIHLCDLWEFLGTPFFYIISDFHEEVENLKSSFGRK